MRLAASLLILTTALSLLPVSAFAGDSGDPVTQMELSETKITALTTEQAKQYYTDRTQPSPSVGRGTLYIKGNKVPRRDQERLARLNAAVAERFPDLALEVIDCDQPNPPSECTARDKGLPRIELPYDPPVTVNTATTFLRALLELAGG